jgi:hypothetical protein
MNHTSCDYKNLMMNIFHFNLLFSAWKARSVTISLVFALAMQGIWAGVHLRELFRSAGMYWFQVWVLPIVIVWLLAKFEPRLLPSPKLRHWLSIGLLVGSLAFAGVLVRYDKKSRKESVPVSESKQNSFKKLGTKVGAR